MQDAVTQRRQSNSAIAMQADLTPSRALLDLSDELLEELGGAVLASSPRDALRFCQACRALRAKLERLQALIESRRLRWLPEMTAEHSVDDGLTLACTRARGCDDKLPWAAAGLLPTVGTSRWTVRVVRSLANDGNGCWIGVCDAAARCAWGLFLYSGRLRRISRDGHGKVDFDASPIEGFPNGNYKQVIKDMDGRPASLRGKATGALVEVLVDHDAGTLTYRINGGPCLVALPPQDEAATTTKSSQVFPQGAALRPYAACYYAGDCLRFESLCLHAGKT